MSLQSSARVEALFQMFDLPGRMPPAPLLIEIRNPKHLFVDLDPFQATRR